MDPAAAGRPRGTPRARQRGFTLIESIFVIVMLAMAAAAVLAMQPKILSTQSVARDELVGQELIRGCAERLLAARRHTGYSSVTTTTCNGMGGLAGFASNPTVTMVDDAGASVTTCSGASCTIRITIAKSSGPAAYVAPITLQLTFY